MRALLLDVSRRDNLSGKVQPFSEVLEAFGGQSVVVVLPGESGLKVAAGGERLAGFDDLEIISHFQAGFLGWSYIEVLGVDIAMLGLVVVLFGDEHTLLEDVLVDPLTISFRDEHCRELLALFGKSRTMRDGCSDGLE